MLKHLSHVVEKLLYLHLYNVLVVCVNNQENFDVHVDLPSGQQLWRHFSVLLLLTLSFGGFVGRETTE